MNYPLGKSNFGTPPAPVEQLDETDSEWLRQNREKAK